MNVSPATIFRFRARLTRLLRLHCLAVVLGMFGAAWAQDNFPTRWIKVVVPYPAGGNTDLVARVFTKELSEILGQSFVIENRPGGSTNVAAEAVARSAPDGYTLFLLQGTSHGINSSLYEKLSYDPIKDFAPIGLLANTVFFLLVHSALPVNGVRDLVTNAKANPGKLAYGSPGVGTPSHLGGELLNLRGGMGVTHVPYKGDAPASVDLMGNRLLYMFSATTRYFKQGKLKALAVADSKRWPLEPQIPSMSEEGFPNFEILSYFGLAAPAKTPEAVLEKLSRALINIGKREETRGQLAELGLVPLIGTRKETAALVASEIEKWRPIIKLAGARAE